jgi:hypothetical protein
MKKFALSYFGIVYCVCLLFVGCQKENSDFTTEPEAIFKIALSSICSDIIIGDRFFTGEAITGADSIQVQVDVLETGTWKFHSDTVNGISVSGSGTVNNKGLQYISVVPKGTPVLPGNFVYTFQTDTTQVNVYASVTDKNITNETVPPDIPYFKLTIDNISYHIINDNNDPSRQVGMWGASEDSGSVGCGIGPVTYPNPPGTGTISIAKNYIGTTNPALTDADFKAFFQPNAYRFGLNTCDKVTDGFFIAWNDSDSRIWSTYYGKGQEGSYFKVVGLTDGYNSNGKYYVKLKMRFKCKLYSYPLGQMKELTNGEMVAYFVRP